MQLTYNYLIIADEYGDLSSNANTIVLQNRAENSLRDEVLKWKEKYERSYL